jgi:hypothetical protein
METLVDTNNVAKCRGKFPSLDSSLKEKLGYSNSCSFPNVKKGYMEHKDPPLKINSEKHLPGYNFCGPGTQVAERLERGDLGVNDLDNGCRVHDVEYMVHGGNKNALMESDKKLTFVSAQIAKRLAAELEQNKSPIAKFLDPILPGWMPSINTLLESNRTYDKLAAESVAALFQGKGILERMGMIDPVTFAEGLNKSGETREDVARKGIELYKKYIM